MRHPLDTDPDVDARYRRMLLDRTASERVVMALGMFDTARAVMVSSFPEGLDERSRRVELFVRTYGRDLDHDTVDRVIARLQAT